MPSSGSLAQTSREAAARLDAADPLAAFRSRFELPPDLIYLDGNSLGPLPCSTPGRLREVAREEWGEGLIRSWNGHDGRAGWIGLGRRVGEKIGRLIGARPGETLVADSTSVNLFKVAMAALAKVRAEGGSQRRVILSSPDNFPTDLYILRQAAELQSAGSSSTSGSEDWEVRLEEDPGAFLAGSGGRSVALLALTQVSYSSGALHDLAELTARAHAAGALTLWDLAHSAGALPLEVAADGADFAVGCGYKYLNGGPGAPAFLYVAERHQSTVESPLPGWLGHARPFAFETSYEPAAGIERFLCGTPPILSLAALEEGVDLLLQASRDEMRRKSQALGELFLELVEARRLERLGIRIACPRAPDQRGSQVTLAHEHGYAVMQALIERRVIGDFRAPDLMRFGLAPLFVRYVDVWDAVDALESTLVNDDWRHPRYRQPAGSVT